MSKITVRNVTTQGIEVVFKNNTEYVHYWLKANDSVTMPSESLTDTLTELARRKILKLTKN
jgi:hypothetical protein